MKFKSLFTFYIPDIKIQVIQNAISTQRHDLFSDMVEFMPMCLIFAGCSYI